MKNESIRVRLTEKERHDLDTLSEKMCLSRSELVRQFLANGIHQNESVKLMKWDNNTIMAVRDCNMLISRVGSNVNQIARACNNGNTDSVSLANEIQSMQAILEDIRKAVAVCQ